MTTGSRVGPREAAWLRPAMGFGDKFAHCRRHRNDDRPNLRPSHHEPRPREKRKDRRANNSFKPTPFRCVACVRSLRSHASPHRSRRGLTQALGAYQKNPEDKCQMSFVPLAAIQMAVHRCRTTQFMEKKFAQLAVIRMELHRYRTT